MTKGAEDWVINFTTATLAVHVQAVRSTKMNEESSRSHLLIYMYLQSTTADGSVLRSKLCLADLAGAPCSTHFAFDALLALVQVY